MVKRELRIRILQNEVEGWTGVRWGFSLLVYIHIQKYMFIYRTYLYLSKLLVSVLEENCTYISIAEIQEMCKSLWKDKEKQLSNFYNKDLAFSGGDNGHWSDQPNRLRRFWRIIALIYWFPFTFLSIYVTTCSSVIFTYVLISTICLMAAVPIFGGFDAIQANL